MLYGFLFFVIIASLFLGFFGARYIQTTEHKDKSHFEKKKETTKVKEIIPPTDNIDKRNKRIGALKEVEKELSGNTD